MIITDPFYAEIRSAINIKKALDHISGLPQLGYCPTKVQQFRREYQLDGRDDSHEERGPEGKFRSRDLANQVLILVYRAHLTVHPVFYRPSLISLRLCTKI